MNYVLAIFLFLASTSAVRAEDPCQPERGKFCHDVKVGGGRMTECLQAHEKDFSAACLAYRKELRAREGQVRDVCRDDYERLCADKKPGHGDIKKCFKANFKNISKVCRQDIKRRRYQAKMKQMRDRKMKAQKK